MKRNVVFLMALMIIASAQAVNVTFKKIWLEHNVMQNGVEGMKVHVAFDIFGMKGQRCTAIAYFDYPKGTGIKDTNGRYCTTGGTVCSTTKFTPSYDKSSYSDLAIFIPNSELHLLSGKRTYYTRVFIQMPSGKFLGNSDYASFDGTIGSQSNNNLYAENSNRGNIGQAGTTIVRESCMFCGGTGRCTICNGTGGTYNGYTGLFYPCTACAQTLRCKYCQGTGVSKTIISSDGNGNYSASDPTGQFRGLGSVYKDDTEKSRSSSRSRSSRGTCSKCHGARYDSSPVKYAPASAHGWMPPHHNSAGSKCSYCGKTYDHYHTPCTECRGYGHN